MPDMNGHPIDHVVVLMLENRGFDHFMGWLYDRANPPLNWYPQRAYSVNWWGAPEAIPDFVGLDWVDLATLANGYTVDGRQLLSQRPIRGAHVRFRFLGIFEHRERRGGHTRLLAQLLHEGLRAFELGGGARRAECADALLLQCVHEA